MLLRLALQVARDDYEDRRRDSARGSSWAGKMENTEVAGRTP
jgi:hypothetical protein